MDFGILANTKGQLKFGGSQMLYLDFQLCSGFSSPNHPPPPYVQRATVLYQMYFFHSGIFAVLKQKCKQIHKALQG